MNSRSLDEGIVAENATNRVLRDGQELLQRGQLYQQFSLNLQDNFRQPVAPQPIVNPFAKAIASAIQTVSNFFQDALQRLSQQLLQQQGLLKTLVALLRPPLETLQKMLASVAAMFFNKKADRNERDEERDALRDDNEAAFLDPFSLITLKEPGKSGFGSNA
ncbi:MAG: hypothetical protein QE263_02775 [Vampirovibrionales bacterium]|nr:hypothetical protein [Vampirovibrionales bacterium]